MERVGKKILENIIETVKESRKRMAETGCSRETEAERTEGRNGGRKLPRE